MVFQYGSRMNAHGKAYNNFVEKVSGNCNRALQTRQARIIPIFTNDYDNAKGGQLFVLRVSAGWFMWFLHYLYDFMGKTQLDFLD